MSFTGTVKNGVIVLEAGVALPEGAKVRVQTDVVTDLEMAAASSSPEDDPLWAIPDLAADTGIADLAINADHYLYGHPKLNDGR